MTSRNLVLAGDTTTHGGVVMGGSQNDLVNRRPMARQGDEVRCPAHGVVRIVEGDSSTMLDGRPVALEGHRTECGAVLIGNAANGAVA